MLRLVCFCAIFFAVAAMGAVSLTIPEPAAYYPGVLAGSAVVLLSLIGLNDLWEVYSKRPTVNDFQNLLIANGSLPLSGFILTWVSYPALLNIAGFFIATVVSTFCSISLIQKKSFLRTLVAVVIFVTLFQICLITFIYVPVPAKWPDRLIDIATYRLLRN